MEGPSHGNTMSVKPTENTDQPVPNAKAWWAFGKAVRLLQFKSKSAKAVTPEQREAVAKILTKFKNAIRNSLQGLEGTELEPSLNEFRSAFDLYIDDKPDEARVHFASVRRVAEAQLLSSKNVLVQIEAARLATVCALYEHANDLDQAWMVVQQLVKSLHNHCNVRRMFAVRIGTGVLNRIVARFICDKKDKPIKHLCIMNLILCDYFLGQGVLTSLREWPAVVLSSTQSTWPIGFTLQLTDIKEGSLQVSTREDEEHCRILLLASVNAIITYGEGRLGIETWCPKTLTQVSSFVDGYAHRTTMAACRGSILYAAKCQSLTLGVNPTISAFNTVTKKPINVFIMVEGECVHVLCGDSDVYVYDIMVITDDGVVHHSAEGAADRISSATSFGIKGHLSRHNSAATGRRLLHSLAGALRVYDLTTGSHVVDIFTTCWKYPVAAGNHVCSFEVNDADVITKAEVRQVSDMKLVITYDLKERVDGRGRAGGGRVFAGMDGDRAGPIISCDVYDNLLVLLVERTLTLWELVSGSRMAVLMFGVPGPLRGHRPSSVCFYKKSYIFVSTLAGSLLRFAISD